MIYSTPSAYRSAPPSVAMMAVAMPSMEIWVLLLFYIDDCKTRAALRVLSREHQASGERARRRVQRMDTGPGSALVTDLVLRIGWWTPWVGMRMLRAPPRLPRDIYTHWESIGTYRPSHYGQDGRGPFYVVRGHNDNKRRFEIWVDGYWVSTWALHSGAYVPLRLRR